MAPRLPVPGSDDGLWGDLLNDFLYIEHNVDGTLKPNGSLASKYTMPADGIPYEDLSSGVQTILDGQSNPAVASVNGQVGAVQLNADDIDDIATSNKFVTSSQISKIDSAETGATADQTAEEILTAIKTVDGVGSGLDAELLAGNSYTAFATASQGQLADSSIQPGDNLSALVNDIGYLTAVPVTSINSKTGQVVLNADDIADVSTTNKFINANDLSKLAAVEPGADVTNASNVEAAGAVMVATIGTLVMAYSTGLQQIAGLTSPAADRILFWDNSANSYAYLTVSTGLAISGTNLSVISSSTTQAGIIETATTAETTAGLDTSKATTPQGLQTFWNDRFINENTMASNSATKAPSQQSVKAYVASSATTVNGRSGAVALTSSDVGITISTNAPSGGVNGDIWLEY